MQHDLLRKRDVCTLLGASIPQHSIATSRPANSQTNPRRSELLSLVVQRGRGLSPGNGGGASWFETKPVPGLTKNIKEVVRLHNQINRSALSSLETAIDAGGIFKSMRDAVGHANWIKYAEEHLVTQGLSLRTIQDYMWCNKNKTELEKAMANTQHAAFLTSIRGAKNWLKGDTEEDEGASEAEGEAAPAKPSKPRKGNGNGSETRCINHLKSRGADEVFDLLKRAFNNDKKLLIELDDLITAYVTESMPSSEPATAQPTMQ